MKQQVTWAAGKSGVEDVLLAREADTAAYSGRLGEARDFSRRAVASAERAEEKEKAASYEADAALRESLFGNAAAGRQRVAAALGLSTGRDVKYGAALALTMAGDAVRAQAMADDLAKRFPQDTVVQFNYLPTLHAQLALSRNDASRAIDALQAAAPYELGDPTESFTFLSLYPVYVRGEAYLAGHQETGAAAAEFQKILDHRGVVFNEPIGALAHLGLARAYALKGDPVKARVAYNDFFALWKDADPDIHPEGSQGGVREAAVQPSCWSFYRRSKGVTGLRLPARVLPMPDDVLAGDPQHAVSLGAVVLHPTYGSLLEGKLKGFTFDVQLREWDGWWVIRVSD